jgi:hypothetical protein
LGSATAFPGYILSFVLFIYLFQQGISARMNASGGFRAISGTLAGAGSGSGQSLTGGFASSLWGRIVGLFEQEARDRRLFLWLPVFFGLLQCWRCCWQREVCAPMDWGGRARREPAQRGLFCLRVSPAPRFAPPWSRRLCWSGQ